MNGKDSIQYADDDYESVWTLLRLRSPALIIGLLLGLGISFITSNFEKVLSENIHVAFFMPFIVYIADAIGTQTETIYSRDLKSGKAKFTRYLWKESILGIVFGIIFGSFAGIIALLWLKEDLLAISVSISTFFAIAVAPITALCITEICQLVKEDPATGSGPIATVIQDMLSVLIYGIISSIIIL